VWVNLCQNSFTRLALVYYWRWFTKHTNITTICNDNEKYLQNLLKCQTNTDLGEERPSGQSASALNGVTEMI
jgi:hypothetical protein